MPRYRIFCLAEEHNDLPSTLRVEARYPAFVIAAAPARIIEQVRQKFPVEELKGPKKPPNALKLPGKIPIRQQKGTPYFYVVRFHEPIRPDWLEKITAIGGQVCDALGRLTLVVKCPGNIKNKLHEELPTKPRITRYVPSVPPDSETSPNSIGSGGLFASFFTEAAQQQAKDILGRKIGQVIVISPTDLWIGLTTHANLDKARRLIVSQNGLRSLESPQQFVLCNNQAKKLICGNVVTLRSAGLGLTGRGELVAVADTGLDTSHLDFSGRIKSYDSMPLSPTWEGRLAMLGAQVLEENKTHDLTTGHGTHVCGSILGSGARSRELGLEPIEGMAPEAQLIFQDLDRQVQWKALSVDYWPAVSPHYFLAVPTDDVGTRLFKPAYDQEARIHCNAWGSQSSNPEYDRISRSLDQFVWDHKDFLIITAAGNEGSPQPRLDKDEDMVRQNGIQTPGNAKNCLTVGATENDHAADPNVARQTYGRDDPEYRWRDEPFNSDSLIHPQHIFAMSSRGPASNNRRKPEIVAPGAMVLSTRSRQLPAHYFGWTKFEAAPQDYMYLGGTSMAAALVTGCAVLVRQYLRERLPEAQRISQPTAALLKAVLIHSARYVPYEFARPESGPADNSTLWWADNEQGWGRIDLPQILNPDPPVTTLFLDETGEDKSLAANTARQFNLTVTDPTQPLRLTLVYTDLPSLGSDPGLINNLNLLVRSPQGQWFKGNDFEGLDKVDSNNNVENIIIKPELLTTGEWLVYVVASDLPQGGQQDFALVISGRVQLVESTTIAEEDIIE